MPAFGIHPQSTPKLKPDQLCLFALAGEQPGEGSGRYQTGHEEDSPANGDPPAIVATVFSGLPHTLLSRTPHLLVPSQPCPDLPITVLLSDGLHYDGHAHFAAFIPSHCTSAAQCRIPQRRSQTTGPPGGMSWVPQLLFTLPFLRPSFPTHSHRDSLPILAQQLTNNVPTRGWSAWPSHSETTQSTAARSGERRPPSKLWVFYTNWTWGDLTQPHHAIAAVPLFWDIFLKWIKLITWGSSGRRSNSDWFKGTFQNNDDKNNIAWKPKYRRCRFVSFTSDKCGVVTHDVRVRWRTTGFQGNKGEARCTAQWQGSGTACPQFTGFPILRQDHVVLEDKWDTTQERIPCCWQVSVCLDGRKALYWVEVGGLLDVRSAINGLFPNPLPCSFNHPHALDLVDQLAPSWGWTDWDWGMVPDKRHCALYRWPSGKRKERTRGVAYGDRGGRWQHAPCCRLSNWAQGLAGSYLQCFSHRTPPTSLRLPPPLSLALCMTFGDFCIVPVDTH